MTNRKGVAVALDEGPWRVVANGKEIHSDDFTVDARLRIDGDFIDAYHRKDYAEWLAETLNAAADYTALQRRVDELADRWELASAHYASLSRVAKSTVHETSATVLAHCANELRAILSGDGECADG